MTDADVERLLEVLESDPALEARLRDRLQRAGPGALEDLLVELAAEKGITLTREQIREHAVRSSAELSDEELDSVAGGQTGLVLGWSTYGGSGSSQGLGNLPLGEIVPAAIAIPLAVSDDDDAS